MSLKERILTFLQKQPNVKVNGGEIERLALSVGYKASNASRRCRELAESGVIERTEIRGSVWYWYAQKGAYPNEALWNSLPTTSKTS